MYDIKRKRWSDVLDAAERDVAHYERMKSKAMLTLSVLPYRDALLSVRRELGRNRRDYFTREDAARVSTVAYPSTTTV